MPTEYQPEFDLARSQAKLAQIVQEQKAIPPQTLHESIIDVLASRGGERWKNLDEVYLSTKAGTPVWVGFYERDQDEEEQAWIVTEEPTTSGEYQVRKDEAGNYRLYKADQETGDVDEIKGFPYLASARLLSILADAHQHTPLEELTDDAYSS